MLVFEKNGQGVWDFDFEQLLEITSKDFVEEVKSTIKYCNTKILDVVFYQTDDFVEVTFYFKRYAKHLSYFNSTGNFHNNEVMYMDAAAFLKHAKVLNLYHV